MAQKGPLAYSVWRNKHPDRAVRGRFGLTKENAERRILHTLPVWEPDISKRCPRAPGAAYTSPKLFYLPMCIMSRRIAEKESGTVESIGFPGQCGHIVGTGVLDGPLRRKAALFAAKFAHRGQILPTGPSGAGPYGNAITLYTDMRQNHPFFVDCTFNIDICPPGVV